MMQPLVSIGMPVFNCEKTLEPALNSILNQTYQNWELFLIDDGSQDKTLDIADSFKDSRIKIIADGLNQQLPNRLNQAIDLSKGKYFARMDGDDISYPQRLQIQVSYLENHPQIDLLTTGCITFSGNGNPRGKNSQERSHSKICRYPWKDFGLTHPTWMGKLSWFRKYKYSPQAIRMEDQEILLRSYQSSNFTTISNILLGYRVEDLSLNKILVGRCNHSLLLFQQALLEKKLWFIYGVVAQTAKALVDIFAISSGLKFKILRHRCGEPLDELEKASWQQIWTACNSKLEKV